MYLDDTAEAAECVFSRRRVSDKRGRLPKRLQSGIRGPRRSLPVRTTPGPREVLLSQPSGLNLTRKCKRQ